jgi:putative SOS response-associated peptidase YedK
MCGRFAIYADQNIVREQFRLNRLPEFSARYNIAPMSKILIVKEDEESGRTAELCRWGLIRAGLKTSRNGRH